MSLPGCHTLCQGQPIRALPIPPPLPLHPYKFATSPAHRFSIHGGSPTNHTHPAPPPKGNPPGPSPSPHPSLVPVQSSRPRMPAHPRGCLIMNRSSRPGRCNNRSPIGVTLVNLRRDQSAYMSTNTPCATAASLYNSVVHLHRLCGMGRAAAHKTLGPRRGQR